MPRYRSSTQKWRNENVIEQVPGKSGSSTVMTSAVTFSYPGALDNGVESPPFYPVASLTYTFIRVSLLVAATSNHVIDVRKNGNLFASYTLTTGNLTMTATISLALLSTDALTVKTNTVTDSNLSVELAVA